MVSKMLNEPLIKKKKMLSTQKTAETGTISRGIQIQIIE